MKWTTSAESAQHAHWFGIKASERRSAPCGKLCKTFVRNGKRYVTHYANPNGESGVVRRMGVDNP